MVQPLRHYVPPPLYFAYKTPRKSTGHGRGGRVKKLHLITEHKSLGGLMVDFLIFQNIGRRGFFFFCGLVFLCGEQELFNLLPCVSVGKYRGETEGTAVSEERG